MQIFAVSERSLIDREVSCFKVSLYRQYLNLITSMVYQSTLHADAALAILLLRLVSPFAIGKYYLSLARLNCFGKTQEIVAFSTRFRD